jgi:2-polyprenyl-6-methoxyphenol hydroxylase-like FAD-dependent oxidoreductase
MNILKDKSIAIVGGGPGGLTLARLLQMKGATVKVYERDLNREVRVQGATLDLHEESGLKALDSAGLMDAFRANFRPGAGKLRIMDKHAVIKMDWHTKENYEETRPEIDRGPLRNILLDSLQPGTVVWDSHFVSMSLINNLWKLEFKNGTAAEADIVIAADGANSKVRPLITSIKPFFAGITAIEGAVYDAENSSPKINALLKGGKIFAFGDNRSLMLGSKGDGSFAFYTSCKTEEDWVKNCGIDFNNKEEVMAWFKKEFAGWDAVWAEMFENAAPHFIPRPQYCMPLDQAWETLPNLTMIGDAAHLMPPYAGEGVNVAMLDALELSECLTSDEFTDTRSAIARFEKQMCARAAEAAQMTLDSTAMLHADDAIPRLLEMFRGFGATSN